MESESTSVSLSRTNSTGSSLSQQCRWPQSAGSPPRRRGSEMSHDTECPYCGAGVDICHDDGYGEVERLTADRDRYKAWHDDVASRRLHVRQENGLVYDAIVRPKPLKENE